MKTAVITGGNSGMGKATAKLLAQKGYHVIIHGRDENKTNNALNEIKSFSGNQSIEAVHGDISSVAGMKKVISAIKYKTEVVDVLVLSTGVILPNRVVTEDGMEMHFAVQYLCRFAIVQGLMPLLKKSEFARIVHVGAPVSVSAKIYFDDLSLKNNYGMFRAMGQSMLANYLFVQEFTKRNAKEKIVMNMMHVGISKTEAARAHNFLIRLLLKIGGKNPMVSAKNVIYLADNEESNFSGYCLNKPGKPQNKIHIKLDTIIADKLWNKSIELIA